MARAKRFYLCNLIPLWEIDNAHLEVDWTQESAKNGEIVEMRVVVKDLDLNMKTPDFTIEFEVNENDVLIFGGLDDRVVTITNEKTDKKKTEHRDFSIIGENDVVPPDQRLKNIFVSPMPKEPSKKLVRAFWAAAYQSDIAGNPEFYFDVKLEFTGKNFKERSDRELSVSKEAFAGAGAGASGSADPSVPGPLVLPAVGWALKEIFAEKPVDQLALLDQPNAGKAVSFVITPDANASLLWILLIPRSNDAPAGGALIKKAWTVPRFLPLENIKTLDLMGKIGDKEVKATTVAQAEAEKFTGQKGGFFAQLTLNEGRAKTTVPDPSVPISEQQQSANTLLSADSKLVALKKTLDKDLAAFAAAEHQNVDPTNSDFAFAVQQFAFNITHSNSVILERPTSSSALKKWTEAFQKAYVIALMIMSTGSKVERREERAGLIAIDLAEAGFITEALSIVGMFSTREGQKFTYETILKGNRATAAQWTLLMNFFTPGTGTFAETDLVDAFGFNSGTFELSGVQTRRLLPTADTRTFLQNLGANDSERNAKLDAITTGLIDAYPNDPDLIWVLSGFLFFHQPYRQPFADKMWRDGKGYLLFKILNSLDFAEPGYGEPTYDGVTLTMARDMTWVYQNKQRFGVDFIVFLCDRAGTPIPRPTNLNFNSLRLWLEDRTETIAGAAPRVYPDNKSHWFQLYNFVTDIYFFHVDRGNVTPDLHGHIGTLVADQPSNLRLRADCDVFATYGTRFLRAMGFTAIGYMGIWEMTAGGDFGVGHAGALLKKDTAYFVVNNKEAFLINASTEAVAQEKLRDSILDILNNPAHKQIHYVAADATGGMPDVIFDRTNATRRADLE
jgi:hypothetical protein